MVLSGERPGRNPGLSAVLQKNKANVLADSARYAYRASLHLQPLILGQEDLSPISRNSSAVAFRYSRYPRCIMTLRQRS